jgi:hypothetical protein
MIRSALSAIAVGSVYGSSHFPFTWNEFKELDNGSRYASTCVDSQTPISSFQRRHFISYQ